MREIKVVSRGPATLMKATRSTSLCSDDAGFREDGWHACASKWSLPQRSYEAQHMRTPF
jgi:hypothetical protein